MPSARARDQGKHKIVKLSPVTANGWLSTLKVISAAMVKHYELARDPAKPVEYFPAPRTYTREQPNALTATQIPIFVAKMKELRRGRATQRRCRVGAIEGQQSSCIRTRGAGCRLRVPLPLNDADVEVSTKRARDLL